MTQQRLPGRLAERPAQADHRERSDEDIRPARGRHPTESSASDSTHGRWLPRWSRAEVRLIGRVGGTPDVRLPTEPDGRAWARLSVATERPHGEPDAPPDWHTVIARDRLAQFVARYITQGRLVYVAGWLTYRSVQGRDGRRQSVEILAAEVMPLDRPRRPDQPAQPEDAPARVG
jgi:single-strand DNA-binding protein